MNVRHPVIGWVVSALVVATANCNSGDDSMLLLGGEAGASGDTATGGAGGGNREGGTALAGARNDSGPGGAGHESGTGEGGALCDPADCPPPSGPCMAAACDSAGHCAEQPKPDGAVAAQQTAGDCKVVVCKGGVLTSQSDDTDIPNDDNDCTDDVCTAGVPSHPARPQTASCGVGLAGLCNGAGSCVGCITTSQCPGEDTECHSRTCTNGTCGIVNRPRGTRISSQTVGDCRANQCDGAGAVETVPDNADVNDDSNSCTTDACSATNVSHTPLPSGTACGASLQCDSQGRCVNCLVAADCPAVGNTCLIRTCTNGTCGTTNATNGTACDDGNACSRSDSCQNGLCAGLNPIICAASDQCHTAGVCNSVTGLCSNPNKANGVACIDGNACTQSDTCQSGVCTGANPVVCTALDQCHTAGTCDTGTGVCSNPNKVNGVACDDGNACTQTDACQSGACTGANPVVCTALDQCHNAGTCAMGTGLCPNPSKADGVACNDGDACTQSDTCQSGACTGANPVVCSALDESCSAGTCLYSPAGVKNSIAIATLSGWTQCYSDTYNIVLPVNTVITQCTKAKLMLACRPTGAATLQLLAWAPRTDVLFDTGMSNTPHAANGVGWYFSATLSWGFAQGGDAINRGACDFLTTPNSAQRLCWHTGVGAGGYRCGANTGLNSSAAFDRLVYQAD